MYNSVHCPQHMAMVLADPCIVVGVPSAAMATMCGGGKLFYYPPTATFYTSNTYTVIIGNNTMYGWLFCVAIERC